MDEYYGEKKKQVELQRKIQRSNMQNQGRIKCLKARDDYLRTVLQEARTNLVKIASSEARYPTILKGLIMEVRRVLNCRYIFIFRGCAN